MRNDICPLTWETVAGVPPPVCAEPDHYFLSVGSVDANPSAECTLREVLSAAPRGPHLLAALIDMSAHSIERSAQLNAFEERSELGGHTLERVFGALHTVCRRRRGMGLGSSQTEKWTSCVVADRRTALAQTVFVCRAIEVVRITTTLIGERLEQSSIVYGVFHRSVTAITTCREP
ncbi:hypothetical protein [Sphingobium sp. Leaf26]|uniref:hypothetical protein n=1 Tax=Sphingobium sp. Leaf26 TaxID=1735693 RepID=UPI000700F6EF|nr:hypothetical protein [Sphingobium sp. Leaf26]